ncbi:hypothetical protein P9A16_31695 [Shinella sp. 838]|uniref:hypothetical protein n=1 Tax=Shinella sp. 838 TaxID=3038164 RepID=UPI002414E11F|nr:hypothetical protein [Shinella sp. 838]MDG4675666.1 hypothetical protein [Shinella sp. 838]
MNALPFASYAFDRGILTSRIAQEEMQRCLRHAVEAFHDEWETGEPLKNVAESAAEFWKAYRLGILAVAPVSVYPHWNDIPEILKRPTLEGMQRVADALEPFRGEPFPQAFPTPAVDRSAPCDELVEAETADGREASHFETLPETEMVGQDHD